MNKRFALATSRSIAAIAVLAAVALMAAAPIAPDFLNGLVWRNVGPFRGGRVSSITGVIGEPGTYYAGFPSAGVWKTTSAGMVWYPVFDDVKEVSSVGSVEVAPSNGNIIYVGTGDQVTGGTINEGNGLWKSVDAGKTWQHTALDPATKQIPSIIVDPRNADVVLAAAQGDAHAKSGTRGVFRTTDGGAHWTRTLFVADTVGVQKLAIAYDRPDVVFATTMRHYTQPLPPFAPPAPVGGGAAGAAGGRGGQSNAPTGTDVYKSVDGGVTWNVITGGGLPRIPNSRTSIAVAANTNAQRVFVVGNNGLFRSDDGGATWAQMAADDQRIRNGQGGYNCGLFVDPKNPDVVYVFNTATYKSTDGGKTFTGLKGAPGGDDPQAHWVDPTNPQRIALGYDQGAIVSLDGGATWSSWYNQSTEQVYHISTDNVYPYWIYATQQDAGAIRTRLRGNNGAVTLWDWNSVNGWEWGTIIPDPLNANTVWASGAGIVKITYPSEQWINVSPANDPALRGRSTSSAPLTFAPWNQRELLAGLQYVMSTTDGGVHWTKISPDLGYPKGVKPPSDTATPVPGAPPAGSIETLVASRVGTGTIWAGTNNGLIHVTKNHGKTWDDVSIPGIPMPARALVEGLDVSPTVAGEAYASVTYIRGGEYSLRLYRTKDFGKSWVKITTGLRANEPVRVVRADPKRAGLLYAGTETAMYVSFDDGDNWQSLQGNLPNTSYRAIEFRDNDILVGTYGRGIWVLDGGGALRQMTPAVERDAVHLFKPDPTVRQRRNTNADTPLPPEMTHALNPPDGMLIFYALAARPAGELTIDVFDSAGVVVRHLSSIAAPPVAEAARPPHPNFWVAPPFALSVTAGLNSTHWDLRYDAPPVFTHSYEINANPGLTPASPEGLLAAPGTYTIKLTVDGTSYSEKAVVTNDPRSSATATAVKAQVALLRKVNSSISTAWDGYQHVATLRSALTAAMPPDSTTETARAIRAFGAKLDSIAGAGGGRGGFGGRGGGPAAPPTFQAVHQRFVTQLTTQENADHAPTESLLAAFRQSCNDLTSTVKRWNIVATKDLPTLNSVLGRSGTMAVSAKVLAVPRCE